MYVSDVLEAGTALVFEADLVAALLGAAGGALAGVVWAETSAAATNSTKEEIRIRNIVRRLMIKVKTINWLTILWHQALRLGAPFFIDVYVGMLPG